MIDRCRRALVAAAAAYLALLPTNTLTFWRSLAFAVGATLSTILIVAAARDPSQRPPTPGRAVLLSVLAWAGWAAASLVWSVDPASSLRELKSDVLWTLVTMVIFYFAATVPDGFRVITGALLASLAFWTITAVGMHWSAAGWDANFAHRGVGAFSTYLATVAPFLLLLAWRPPLGTNTGPRAVAVGALVFVLVLVTARMSDNRIVWLAFAASVVVIALYVRPALPLPRVAAVGGALLLAFVLLFAEAARDRAAQVYAPETSVAQTLAADPRIALWKHAAAQIRERPWHGHGYGLQILADRMRADSGNALITHPHNMFVGQWLQTGAIGLGLLLAMIGALTSRYLAFVRSGDTELGRLGTLGLAVLVAFVVKNLTDDFFFRANGKILFAAHALLLGAGALRLAELGRRA